MGLARLASEASAATESGGLAETQDWSGGASGEARRVKLAEPERASHSEPPLQWSLKVGNVRLEGLGRRFSVELV
jgi:hypothetical protein